MTANGQLSFVRREFGEIEVIDGKLNDVFILAHLENESQLQIWRNHTSLYSTSHQIVHAYRLSVNSATLAFNGR